MMLADRAWCTGSRQGLAQQQQKEQLRTQCHPEQPAAGKHPQSTKICMCYYAASLLLVLDLEQVDA